MQEVAPGETIIFTYDVSWKESDTHWASRWDIYLTMNHAVKNRVGYCWLLLWFCGDSGMTFFRPPVVLFRFVLFFSSCHGVGCFVVVSFVSGRLEFHLLHFD